MVSWVQYLSSQTNIPSDDGLQLRTAATFNDSFLGPVSTTAFAFWSSLGSLAGFDVLSAHYEALPISRTPAVEDRILGKGRVESTTPYYREPCERQRATHSGGCKEFLEEIADFLHTAGSRWTRFHVPLRGEILESGFGEASKTLLQPSQLNTFKRLFAGDYTQGMLTCGLTLLARQLFIGSELSESRSAVAQARDSQYSEVNPTQTRMPRPTRYRYLFEEVQRSRGYQRHQGVMIEICETPVYSES
ncbi:hypothetical protein BKA64DRAFT_769323 [Cadophora sp. MPI-SDFR-AT-0126]|nr:hypothetical protein BKA64DRAFT_769323 [Leotiomycetes sp. MPI-SDFR-AT-0126]